MLKIIENWLAARSVRKLVGACFGDKRKAERLMQFETKKAFWINRRTAAKYAFDRLEKDRSR